MKKGITRSDATIDLTVFSYNIDYQSNIYFCFEKHVELLTIWRVVPDKKMALEIRKRMLKSYGFYSLDGNIV